MIADRYRVDPGADLEELIAAWQVLFNGNSCLYMNQLPPLSERVRRAFEPARGGVVGLVDGLLGLCREQGLQLDWQADRCRVHPLGGRPEESTEIPLSKSVFRAILARMAALCNERVPGSVSPYGGEGELSVGTDPPTVLRVMFTNIPGEQKLEVGRVGDPKNGATDDEAFVGVGPGARTRNPI